MIFFLLLCIISSFAHSLRVDIRMIGNDGRLDTRFKEIISQGDHQLTEAIKETIKQSLVSKGFKIDKELGKGMYGTVFKARYLDKGQDVAIKISKAFSAGSRYYSMNTNRSCCMSNCVPQCTDLRYQLPSETYALLMARNLKGVIALRGIGAVFEESRHQIAFYITVMQYIDNSKPGNKFATCIRQAMRSGKKDVAFGMLKVIMKKFHQANTALFNIGLYHNDLKNDNSLITYTASSGGSSSRQRRKTKKSECDVDLTRSGGELGFYLIDFGNAITPKRSNGELLVDINNIVPTFQANIAPEMDQLRKGSVQSANVARLLSWYFGAFLFELITGQHIIQMMKQQEALSQQQLPHHRAVRQSRPMSPVSFPGQSGFPPISYTGSQQHFYSRPVNFPGQNGFQQMSPTVSYTGSKNQPQPFYSQMATPIDEQQRLDSFIEKTIQSRIGQNEYYSKIMNILRQTLKLRPEHRKYFRELTNNPFLS